MVKFFERVKRWYLWKFHHYVPALRRGATSWQQHAQVNNGFFWCRCNLFHQWNATDYFVRSQEHIEGCQGYLAGVRHGICDCPITDARYCWICPSCKLGHWMDATKEKQA